MKQASLREEMISIREILPTILPDIQVQYDLDVRLFRFWDLPNRTVNRVVNAVGEEVIHSFAGGEALAFYLDLQPTANLSHDHFFIFISATSYAVVSSEWPPHASYEEEELNLDGSPKT